MRDTFIARLSEHAEKDDRIFLITGDLGFKVLDEYRERFPDQFLNAGVAEQNMTGIATGLALEGRIVFTYSIANFVTMRCLEQIRNDALYHEANVNIVCIGGGFSYGSLGMSHHATEDLSIMRAFPDITICAPGDLWETAEATTALVKTPGPSYLRLDKSAADPTHSDESHFELGKARMVRQGRDLTLVAVGGILEEALRAADELATEDINVRVLSLHTIKPLDTKSLISAARETGGIISIEEHTIHGGLGSAIAEQLLELGEVPKRFKRIGLKAGFSSIVGSQQYLRERYEMSASHIVSAAKDMLKE